MPAEATQQVQRLELPSPEFLFGSTAGMRKIREKLEGAQKDDLPVLIEGESGTGKELISLFLHRQSPRREGPFLKLNCSVTPPKLLEGEIFGFEKGFSAEGADPGRGLVGRTSRGTLFLDEIGDMDATLQEKLSWALESGYFRPLGGAEESARHARFVGATSTDLEAELPTRAFHRKLLGCFSHHRVRLLPLRERKQDIPQLCEYLLGKFARDFGRPVPRLSSNSLEAFQQWKWPGNIRELENWIARIVIFGAEEVIGLEFNRQLMARGEPAMRSWHAARLKIGRARRARRNR